MKLGDAPEVTQLVMAELGLKSTLHRAHYYMVSFTKKNLVK